MNRSHARLVLFTGLAVAGCTPPLDLTAVVDGDAPPDALLAVSWTSNPGESDFDVGSPMEDGKFTIRVEPPTDAVVFDHETSGKLVLIEVDDETRIIAESDTFIFYIEAGHADLAPGFWLRSFPDDPACLDAADQCWLSCESGDCGCERDCTTIVDHEPTELLGLRMLTP